MGSKQRWGLVTRAEARWCCYGETGWMDGVGAAIKAWASTRARAAAAADVGGKHCRAGDASSTQPAAGASDGARVAGGGGLQQAADV